MDENYRAGDLLRELEGKAREAGDLCPKHNQYLGGPGSCPWCEIDALNEKRCPGDLKPSVVAKWPMAARRAMMFFQVELGRLQESLSDAQELNRHLLDKLKEADWLKKNDQLTEELRVKTVDATLLQQRIEDLEAKIAEFVDGENRGEGG